MMEIDASAETTFKVISRIGGSYGYWGADWLRWLRGAMDKVVGGPGLRRGRRHPEEITYGEALDLWRVDGYVLNQLLSLRAEMRLPSDAVLVFTVDPLCNGRSRVTQTAKF